MFDFVFYFYKDIENLFAARTFFYLLIVVYGTEKLEFIFYGFTV